MRKRATSCPVNPNARSCDASAEMTWPMLGKFCKRATAHAISCEGASNPASKSCSVVSSVGTTTTLPSLTRSWVGEVGARAKDDADMDSIPESRTGKPQARSLWRPTTHPLPAILLLLKAYLFGAGASKGPAQSFAAFVDLIGMRAVSRMATKRRKPRPVSRAGLRSKIRGSDLLSHPVSRAVPSALEGLTSLFGMGRGVSPPPTPPQFQI